MDGVYSIWYDRQVIGREFVGACLVECVEAHGDAEGSEVEAQELQSCRGDRSATSPAERLRR